MPPFDREAALKAAEKALKLGKVDAAIVEYVKVVEAQPRDWNSANALGDLYVRAKQVEKGVQQYTRIADHLADEGFYPKAAALYKKILKIKPDDEYSMLQSGDLAAKQGTLADAKQFFLQVAERRKARGDRKGAAEVAIRLGTLDPEDLDARLRAGAARRGNGRHGDRAARVPRGRRPGSRNRTATPTRWCRCNSPTTSTSQMIRSARGCSRGIWRSNPEAARKVASRHRRAERSGRRPTRRRARAMRRSTSWARWRTSIPPTSRSAQTWRSRYVSRGDLDKARELPLGGNRRQQSGAVAHAG